MNIMERTSEASSVEQANEGAQRANKQAEKRVTQYFRPGSWMFHYKVISDIASLLFPIRFFPFLSNSINFFPFLPIHVQIAFSVPG